MVGALGIFDHYNFRGVEKKATVLTLAKPPSDSGKRGFDPDYCVAYRIRDREIFLP